MKVSIGLFSKGRTAAVLPNAVPFSVGEVAPTAVSFRMALARLLTSCTAPGAQVATRWIAGGEV